MSSVKNIHAGKRNKEPDPVPTMMFDYYRAAKAANISSAMLEKIEREVKKEFPHDPMLMELHVLRAINAFSAQKSRKKKR